MKILYISEAFVDLPLFESQVHTLCNMHSDTDKVTLLALCTKNELGKDIAGRKYILIKKRKFSTMIIPFFNKLFSYLFFSDKKLLRECDIIHCRGHIGSAYAINICKKYNIEKPIIADIRGELTEELKHSTLKYANYLAKQSRKLEMFIFKNTPYFFFVSENMRKYYSEKYLFDQTLTAVFPTIVNEQYFYRSAQARERIRSSLQLENKFVYAYVGSADYWQNLDKILVTFNIALQKNPHLFLLCITNDPKAVTTIIEQNNLSHDNINILSLPYENVGEYLNAADAGIIIRDNNLINYVASPTKVNEYLATGLKVVDKLDKIGDTTYSKDGLTYISTSDIIRLQKEAYAKFILSNNQDL